MPTVRGYGLHGGIDLLSPEERVIDAEISEKIESPNLRSQDQLDTALAQILNKPPGGYILNYMLELETPGDRQRQIEYTRFYFGLGLLVDMMQKSLNDSDRADNMKMAAEHASYAAQLHMKYLCIEGSISAEEIANVIL